jgi:hypothetical protein
MSPVAQTHERAGGKKAVSRTKEDPPPKPLSLEELEAQEETVARPQRRAIPGDLSIEARVVYLGGNRVKTVYFPGTVTEVERDEGTKGWHPSEEGATSYDFSRVDSKGRTIKERMTKDGRPFSICRNIAHCVKFLREQDEEGSAQFEIRAVPEVRLKIERYARLLREQEAKAQDRGAPVLAAMGLA